MSAHVLLKSFHIFQKYRFDNPDREYTSVVFTVGRGSSPLFFVPRTGTGLAFTYMKSECPGIPRGGGGEGGGGSEALAQLAIGTFFPKMITSFFFMASLSQFVLMGN